MKSNQSINQSINQSMNSIDLCASAWKLVLALKLQGSCRQCCRPCHRHFSEVIGDQILARLRLCSLTDYITLARADSLGIDEYQHLHPLSSQLVPDRIGSCLKIEQQQVYLSMVVVVVLKLCSDIAPKLGQIWSFISLCRIDEYQRLHLLLSQTE